MITKKFRHIFLFLLLLDFTTFLGAKERNHYDVLDISSNSSFEDIRNAYQNIIVRFNPDPVPKKYFKAYEILIDPKMREYYDTVVLGLSPEERFSPPQVQNTRQVPIPQQPTTQQDLLKQREILERQAFERRQRQLAAEKEQRTTALREYTEYYNSCSWLTRLYMTPPGSPSGRIDSIPRRGPKYHDGSTGWGSF